MKKHILPVIILTVMTIVTLGCGGHGADDYIIVGGDTPIIPSDDSGEITPKKKVLWKGSGTVEDPYLVPDADHLDDIRNKSMSACYKQTAHINLSKFAGDGNYWQPIGISNGNIKNFTGKYDGNGYCIYNLSVNKDTDRSGLFGCLAGAEISNLVINQASICGGPLSGIFAGLAIAKSVIRNCYAFRSTVIGSMVCGGIVGQLRGSKIINSRVSESDVSGKFEIGGIVGKCYGEGYDSSVVDNCYVNHSMVNGWGFVGAIAGCVTGRFLVSNSFACGNMSVNGTKLSSETDGLIGTIDRDTVTSCYYWKDGYKQGTTTGWTDWDTSIWNIPSTVPCLPTLRVEQEPPSEE